MLETWLLSVKDAYPVKFLVTSCALLYSMWLDIPADRWSGFPRERERLLHLLAANGIENVYLLAGDLHAAHAVRAELYGPQERRITLWEFCSTPFEQKSDQYHALPVLAAALRSPGEAGAHLHRPSKQFRRGARRPFRRATACFL